MAQLVKKKNQPTVCFPAELEKEKYTGALYGYFIEDTNYYNVIDYRKPYEDEMLKIKREALKLNLLEGIPISPSPRTLVECRIKVSEIFEKKPTWATQVSNSLRVVGYYENDILQFEDRDGNICKKEPYSLKLDVFSRNTGILESDIMLKKGAMFIGCGSVGSLFALELAKAGVGRFLLIDNDILGYHNLCRHQCGMYDVGKYKTEAVKERILQINPTAKVITQNAIVQEVPLAVFDEFCDKDTIVIGGADNREGDLYANQIAQEIGMPLMSIGCWERAFAGEIFYCLPEGMPTYSDFMYALGDTSGRTTQNRKFYTNEEDLAKAAFEPGISVDIDFVTVIAVKLALDILNRDNPNYTPRLINHLSQYTLVCNTNNPKIGGDNAEIFSYPLQVTTSIEVPYAPKEENHFDNNNLEEQATL